MDPRTRLEGLHSRLVNPAYTGANRCLPCTGVNIVIAGAASAVVAAGVTVAAGVLAFAASVVVVALRGYLVPGTPALTARLLPDRVLAWFHGPESRHPADRARTGGGSAVESTASGDAPDGSSGEWETLERMEAERDTRIEPRRYLSEAGVVEDGADDPELTESFARTLADQTPSGESVPPRDGDDTTPSIDTDAVAAMLGVDPAAVASPDPAEPAVEVDGRIWTWPSRAALLADVHAHEVLGARAPDWDAVPRSQRLDVLAALRPGYRDCPGCGGSLELGERTVQSCCGGLGFPALICADCGDVLVDVDDTDDPWALPL